MHMHYSYIYHYVYVCVFVTRISYAYVRVRLFVFIKYIYDYLDARNISKDLVHIVKEKAIVSGPIYNPKNNDNSKYFEYQYFSIWAE